MRPSKDVLGGGARQTNQYHHLSASDHHMSKTPGTMYAYEDEYDQEQEVSRADPKETAEELVRQNVDQLLKLGSKEFNSGKQKNSRKKRAVSVESLQGGSYRKQ